MKASREVFWAGYTRKGILQGKVMCIVSSITQICFHSPLSFNNTCDHGRVKTKVIITNESWFFSNYYVCVKITRKKTTHDVI